MPVKSNDGDGPTFDATPYLKIVIDKDGRWFQNGAEIIHPEIYKFFNSLLEKGDDGGYRIRLGKEVCRVEVEDAPFVVERLLDDEGDEILIELNDKTREPFDPERFLIGPENVPYTKVKGGVFDARFSRPAYHRLARYIVGDEEGEDFHLLIRGRRIPIRTGDIER
jgi:hypothetical protein